jgi:hypothetical protein
MPEEGGRRPRSSLPDASPHMAYAQAVIGETLPGHVIAKMWHADRRQRNAGIGLASE